VCSWYIALEKDKHEINASFVAVYGFEGDGGRLGCGVENFDVFDGDCFGVEFIESILLSSQQHAKPKGYQEIDGDHSISLEVRRSDKLRCRLPSAKDRTRACVLVAVQTQWL
jgi:hypothetical protein